MNFGPAEMAQTMDAAKALITVAFVFSIGIGIVLGAIVALRHRHGAADQSFQSGMPPAHVPLPAAEEIERATAPSNDADERQKLVNAACEIRAEYEVTDDDEELLRLADRQTTAADVTWLRKLLAQWEWDQQRPSAETVLAKEIDATAPHRPRSPVPRAGLRLIRPVDLLGIIILIAITGGGYLSYYTSKRSDFTTTNNNQVRIQPLPSTVESQTESMILKQLGIRPLFPTVAPQQQMPETTPRQPGIQPLPPTIEPQQQMPGAAPDQPPLIEPPPPTRESQPRSAAVGAENINANLCEASSRHAIERTLSSAPTKELAKYVEGLKRGSYSFNYTISGDAAAKQLRFGRRFAVTHDQAVEEVRARLARKSTVHIDEIVEYFSQILRQEQTVDRLAGDRDHHFPAVLYLRALQEGECAFPYVLRDTPTAQAMLNHLARAYPDVKKRFASEPFAKIYDATVAYGRNQIKQDGSVSIYRLVEEMRRAIVQSANPNVATTPSIFFEPPSTTPAVPQNRVPQTKYTGSGFFVTQAGHLLTNAHVVSGCTTVSIKRGDGQAGVAQVIALDQNDDLALLKLNQRTETTAAFRIGRPPRAGESAVVFGFPLSQLLASTGNVTTGVVTALAGPLNDPHQIQISAPVQRGNSGGPVLDASGYLIGVVVSKLNPVLGDVPQNVNFAIKASTAANFLDAHGIAYKSAGGEKDLPIPDIVEQARGFSAQVLCQG
jgi:S1-C subfamily serine protease